MGPMGPMPGGVAERDVPPGTEVEV
jgi:hypothetical protein